jgi:hypothetical protein
MVWNIWLAPGWSSFLWYQVTMWKRRLVGIAIFPLKYTNGAHWIILVLKSGSLFVMHHWILLLAIWEMHRCWVRHISGHFNKWPSQLWKRASKVPQLGCCDKKQHDNEPARRPSWGAVNKMHHHAPTGATGTWQKITQWQVRHQKSGHDNWMCTQL